MPSQDDSIRLLARWKEGDEDAAEEIFERYLHRLAALARKRLSQKMQQRVDAEDVVQSAYRSFFRQARENRYELSRSGDLWRLLAAITVNKTLRQIEFHRAAKRSVTEETTIPSDDHQDTPVVRSLSREPTAEEELALADELESFMQPLDASERQVLEMRLQDFDSEEIAAAIGRSTRTVRRILERLKNALTAHFENTTAP
ncbi:MAG: hypothetical protein CL681_12120 [Blastopirellula sp.]|nr:hypothetical protein [Blastopirellula sp.]